MVIERTANVDAVLLDATTFLLERCRKELEQASDGVDRSLAEKDLERTRDLERRLVEMRRVLMQKSAAGQASQLEQSKYHEVPGQEDF
jgi:hypothetical protein